ncbi:MAG: Permease of the major facilitator superfamily, partial [Rhodospirillales bacterium]|nr:Permease of the major facilitator superfamily [Rhodospirillales bacterium]
IGQAIVGPLADRFGRRPVLLTGIAIFCMSTALSAWAADIWVLIALRFIQGLCAFTGRIVIRAVIRDMYSREMGARMMSYTTMIGTMIPIFGPIIAGQLLLLFGWQSVFLFMSAFGFLVFTLVWFNLKETLAQKDEHAIRPFVILGNFADFLRNRTFLVYAVLAFLPTMGLIAFITASAPVLIGTRGLNAGEFSLAFALVMATNTAASFANAQLLRRWGFDRMIFTGTAICTLMGALMLALALGGIETTAAIIGPMMIFMVGSVFITNQALISAVMPFPERAGAASSLVGIMQGFFSATLVSFALGFFPENTAIPMASVLLFAGACATLLYLSSARSTPAKKPA